MKLCRVKWWTLWLAGYLKKGTSRSPYEAMQHAWPASPLVIRQLVMLVHVFTVSLSQQSDNPKFLILFAVHLILPVPIILDSGVPHIYQQATSGSRATTSRSTFCSGFFFVIASVGVNISLLISSSLDILVSIPCLLHTGSA